MFNAGAASIVAAALVVVVVLLIATLGHNRRKRDKFEPTRVNTCCPGPVGGVGVIAGPFDAHNTNDVRDGTVVWDPKLSPANMPERAAGSPEVAEAATMMELWGTPTNPVTGIGRSATVRLLGDPHHGAEFRQRPASLFELQPAEPGALRPSPDDDDVSNNYSGRPGADAESRSDDAFAFRVSLSHRPRIGAGNPSRFGSKETFMTPRESVALAPWAAGAAWAGNNAWGRPFSTTTVDTDFDAGIHMSVDNSADDEIYEGLATERRKENLVSRRSTAFNDYTASRVGLGMSRADPRFEPGSRMRVAGGDASSAPGTYAGGITLGSLASSTFRPAGSWRSRAVFSNED